MRHIKVYLTKRDVIEIEWASVELKPLGSYTECSTPADVLSVEVAVNFV